MIGTSIQLSGCPRQAMAEKLLEAYQWPEGGELMDAQFRHECAPLRGKA